MTPPTQQQVKEKSDVTSSSVNVIPNVSSDSLTASKAISGSDSLTASKAISGSDSLTASKAISGSDSLIQGKAISDSASFVQGKAIDSNVQYPPSANFNRHSTVSADSKTANNKSKAKASRDAFSMIY